jgi:outer membrane protein TolC
MNIFKNIILIVILCLLSSPTFSRESNGFSVYSGINEIKLNIGEDEYKEIIRLSLFEQPEFQYISSLTAEEKFNLKFAKRNRFPVISGNILNDESLDRNITDITSVRKRRDDSFDATVELTQTLYSGGSVNAGIRAAKSRSNNKNKEKQKTISQLILDANTTYLDAAKASFILNYAEDILKLLKPFKTKVDDRVKAGIMDPVDYALFSVRLNTLETRIYQLKSNSEKDKNQYTVFFKKNFEKLAFPMFSIEGDAIYKNNKSYDVEMSELSFVEKKRRY